MTKKEVKQKLELPNPNPFEYGIKLVLLKFAGDVDLVFDALNSQLDAVATFKADDKKALRFLFSRDAIQAVKDAAYTKSQQEAFDAICAINEIMGDHPLRGII